MTVAETKTISQEQYWALLGLFVLAKKYQEQMNEVQEQMNEVEQAAAALVGETDDGGGYYGWISDELYDTNPNVDRMLKRMGVVLAPK